MCAGCDVGSQPRLAASVSDVGIDRATAVELEVLAAAYLAALRATGHTLQQSLAEFLR